MAGWRGGGVCTLGFDAEVTDGAGDGSASAAWLHRFVSSLSLRSRSSIDSGEGADTWAGALLDRFCNFEAAAAAAFDIGLLPLGGRTLCGARIGRGARGIMLLGTEVTFDAWSKWLGVERLPRPPGLNRAASRVCFRTLLMSPWPVRTFVLEPEPNRSVSVLTGGGGGFFFLGS